MFIDVEHNLKFKIDIDKKKNLTLEVNFQAFEDLPLRLYPIRIANHGDIDDKQVQALITLNGVEFDR